MGMAEGSLARSKSIKKRTVTVAGEAEPAADDGSLPRTKLNYVKAQAETTQFLGMPRLLHWNVPFTCKQIGALIHCGSMTEQHEVSLHDARAAGLAYESTGVALEPLRSQVKDWSQVSKKGSAEQLKYQAELEAIVRKLHPDVKAMAWSTFLLRGGPGENGPAAGAIHLDWFPDVPRVKSFLAQHTDGYHDLTEGAACMEREHPGEALQLKIVLGLWKPRNVHNPVQEAPLVVCDPTTVDIATEAVPQEQSFHVSTEGKRVPVANMAANLKFSPRHKWYYYPQQTADEVMVFRHATLDNPSFANFHCGGVLPLPPGMEKRSSVETRVMLYF